MKIPYAMTAALDIHKRHAQMAVGLYWAELRQYPRLQQVPIRDDQTLTLACYGPSLADTWQTMQHPILSMSGATRWLADRGVIPDFHLDMDPRAHKVGFLEPPVPGVRYLMASSCHPRMWEVLNGQQVTLWHTYSGQSTYDYVASVDPQALVIHGGSTIGLTALHIGGVLGYRHFEIHGMDGSGRADRTASDGQSWRHVGPHHGTKQQDGITWNAGGRTYQTSKIMANAVSETLNAITSFPMFCVFHGDGLTQALIREQQPKTACCADEIDRATAIRRMTAHVMEGLTVQPGDWPANELWDRLCQPLPEEMALELAELKVRNEARRVAAKYNTGSITVEQMSQLRALCAAQRPKTIVEVGTFIGNSTLAMQADQIYTCDRDNDCLPSGPALRTFPYTKSTDMLKQLAAQRVQVDLFFFDGRIQPDDLPLIQLLSHSGTVFVMDDYVGQEKGVINAKLMGSALREGWLLVEPDPRLSGKSTLAAIAPRSLFQ